MICTKCGEENSDGFRFCGMCGTLLEARRPAGAPRVAGTAETPRTAQSETKELQTSVTASATMRADHTVPPTAGPSFLGLNQPLTDGPDRYGPTFDSLRDKSFSGLDSFFEPEEPKIGARRVVLLLVLLVALGAGGWWAFSNYNKMGAAISGSSQTAATKPETTEAAAGHPASNPKSSADTPSSSNAGSAQPVAPATVPPAQSQNANPAPVVEQKAEQKAAEKTEQKAHPSAPVAAKPADKARPSREQKIARADATAAPRPPVATPASDDKGDQAFRKGEAYLYGRGLPENCDEAVKNLKAASAKQNAKARSTFGTMYATGHCVPRDLPTSYSWFALALRADPNNQILEKDLVAVWNQMTPPERQMATRMKQ